VHPALFRPYSAPLQTLASPNAVRFLLLLLLGVFKNCTDFLATGIVILISIAIAAGVVFLLALVGILWTLFSRRDDKLAKFEGAEDDDDDSTHHRPSSLLEHINAATRTTILGASPFGNSGKEDKDVRDRSPSPDQDPFAPDASNYMRAETPSDAVGGIMTEETSRPAQARYSFDGTGDGELPISAGSAVEVLDDRDPAYVSCFISFALGLRRLFQMVVRPRCENWAGGCCPRSVSFLILEPFSCRFALFALSLHAHIPRHTHNFTILSSMHPDNLAMTLMMQDYYCIV
jgi:hypothetical protein